MPRALVADPHPLIRASIRNLLQQENFKAVQEASNGVQALSLAREAPPDLIILDIAIPKLDGFEVIRRLASFGVNSKILVVTALSPILYAPRCMNVGASGFVSKVYDLNTVSKAIATTMSGYTFFPNLMSSSASSPDTQSTDSSMISELSDRELLVLQKLSQGYSNKEIGEVMFLSNKTISAYKTRISEKLKLKSVVAFADFAKKNGLI